MMSLTFETNGKTKTVRGDEVAFLYPSIAAEGDFFITLKNGKQFRAKNVKEHTLESGYESIAAQQSFY